MVHLRLKGQRGDKQGSFSLTGSEGGRLGLRTQHPRGLRGSTSYLHACYLSIAGSVSIASRYEGLNYELFNLALQRERVRAANSGCSEGWNSRSISSSVGRLPSSVGRLLRRWKCYRIVIQWSLVDHIANSVHRLFTFPTSPSKIWLLSLSLVHILDLVRNMESPATRLAASRLRFVADGTSSPAKASIQQNQ